MQQAGTSEGLGALGAREMIEELNERIKIVMAENTVMADQVSVSVVQRQYRVLHRRLRHVVSIGAIRQSRAKGSILNVHGAVLIEQRGKRGFTEPFPAYSGGRRFWNGKCF